MKDYELDVLEQYEIEVNSARRTRGAVLCETNRGVMLLKELDVAERRVALVRDLQLKLLEEGVKQVDLLVENREGALVSKAEDGTKYLLKKWFHGRECENAREGDLAAGAGNLAVLHKAMEGVTNEAWDDFCESDLREEYRRYNRELKKIRSFIRGKTVKGEFELLFLKEFPPMYDQARRAEECLLSSSYDALLAEAKERRTIAHGDYNYHNLIVTREGMTAVNLERARLGVQAGDLYYYLRKSMEKCGWNERIAGRILGAYEKKRKLTKEEREYLAIRLAYPEKFRKIANTYFRSNKAWIPEKYLEKLALSVEQSRKRERFLQDIFAFHF